jgi:hypothetical protein
MEIGDRDERGSADADRAQADAGGVGKPPRRLTMSPQEKKALIYRRDGRNGYGENDKASRKNVPRARARSHRELRRADKAVLRDVDAALQTAPLRLRKPAWKKSPDISLGLHVRRQRLRRAIAEARRRGEPEPDRSDWYE